MKNKVFFALLFVFLVVSCSNKQYTIDKDSADIIVDQLFFLAAEVNSIVENAVENFDGQLSTENIDRLISIKKQGKILFEKLRSLADVTDINAEKLIALLGLLK